ncbi:MAG: leucine-rich repeat protein [Clostridia bacterium]|nr:leucine-rich repeat protein [Clostridia bacterium]
MKKTVLWLLAALLAFTVLFVACDDTDDPQPPSGSTEQTTAASDDGTNEPGTEDASEPEAGDTSDPGTEDTNDPGTEDTNEPGTEDTSEPGTEDTNEPGTEDTNEPGTEDTSEPETEPHVHAFGDWTTVKDATCTENGEQQRTCDCGETETQSVDALGHVEGTTVVENTSEPTCSAAGSYEEVIYCSVCNAEMSRVVNTVDPLAHTASASVEENRVAATCTLAGSYEKVVYCSVCHAEMSRGTVVVNALGHTEVIDAAVAPTCTETGLTEGKHCEVCNEVFVAQDIVDALGHTEVVDAAVAPTCTETGLTEGKHCSVCNEVLVAQEIVDALGHTPGAEATCTEPQTCTVCGEQLASANGHTPGAEPTCTANQTCLVCGIELAPALGHAEVIDAAVAPDCVNTGLTEGKHCSVCDEVFVAQEEVAALGHTEVVDAAVAPDCINTGLTEGKHCSVCGEVLVAQEEVAALGHAEVVDAAVAPDCVNTGLTEGKHCSVCGEVLVAQEVVDALGHTEMISEAVAPTCTETGLTEGSHCFVCGLVLVAQEEIPATGHNYQAVVTAPTCADAGYTIYTCLDCGDTYVADEVAALGHDFGVCQPSDEKWHVAVCERCSTEMYTEHSFADGICTFCNFAKVITFLSFDECDAWIGETQGKAFFNPGQHTAWDNIAKVGLDVEYIRVWGWVGFCSETVGEFGYQIGDNEPVFSSDFYVEPDQAVIDAAAIFLAKSASRMKIMIPVADLVGEYTVKALVRDAAGNVATLVEFTLIKTEESDNPEIPDEPDTPDDPEMPVIPEGENWIVDPRDLPTGCITGHMPDIVTKENHPSHYMMIQAANLTSGAMLHQGSIYLGDVDLSNYGKVIIYYASDWSELTQEGLAAAKEQGFGMIGLTGYDCNNIMNPDRGSFIAAPYTPDGGWTVTAHEVDLTDVDYSGPVYISADFLEAQFIIIDRIVFVWGEQGTPDEPEIPDEPDTPDDPDTPDKPADEASEGLAYKLNEEGTGYVVTGIGTCTDTDVVIPAMYEGLPVVEIGYLAFRRCDLTSITMPDSITSIGDSAFFGCTALTSITIPDGVTSIGVRTFDSCYSLMSITIPGSVTSIGDRAFKQCNGLTSVTIGNGVTSIGNSAFALCTSLTSITLPDSVTSIGNSPFAFCDDLTSIVVTDGNPRYHSRGDCVIETESKTLVIGCKASVIPVDGSVTSIGATAFSYCRGLTSITIPDSVTSIGDFAFSGCTGLISITIPGSVTSIGDSAFSGCTGLTSITIPDSVTNIGESAFAKCTGLTGVTIGNGVTSIGNSAFSGCSGLTSILIPNSVTNIGNLAFEKCTGLTSITIPDSVTSIGGYAFSYCTGLINITIPDSVTDIGGFAFSGCTGLTSIIIPDGVTSIRRNTFGGCIGLTNIFIPSNVTSLASSAFGDCSGLLNIVVAPDNPVYRSEGNCIIEIETNKLVLGCRNSSIPDGVTQIGMHAFVGCTGLTSITIPNSVTLISRAAFLNCTGLTDVYYLGTEEEWAAVEKYISYNNNECFHYATIHFNGESAEPEPEDPQAPVFEFSATYIAKAALEGFSPNHIASAILSGDASFVTLTSTDGGDPYFYLYSPSDGIRNKGARYIVIKYRTTVEGSSGEFFVGSGAGPKGGSDEVVFTYIADGEWHLAIADISTVSAVNESYVLNYLRYDPYLDGQYQSIDVAYIAAFHSVEAAEKHFEQSMSGEQPNQPDTPEIPDEPHDHAFGDWMTVKDATCTENGEQQRTCDCGEVETQSIDALGHTEVIDPAVAPTSTETGLTEGSHCSVCDEVLVAQKVVPKLGHYSNPEAYSDDYGYSYLGTMSQGTAMQSLYDLIDQAAMAFHSDVNMDATDNVVASLNFKQYGLSEDQAIAVWLTYKNDHPLYYWISTTVSMTDRELFLLTEDAYDTGAERAVYNALVYSAVEEYLTELQGETSNYRIALALHDAIIYAVDYAYEDDGVTPQDDAWAHNILGVFENQSGVCESYARTFQLLLNFLDVENVFVTGQSYGQEHAWNLVQMDDGNWYWFDLTWDDTPTWMWGISYNYFCVNDSQNVNWSDGIWGAPEASFVDTHIISSPSDQGVDFLYGLPARSDTPFTDADWLLRETFSEAGLEYVIVGYNAVQLTGISINGDVVIPETVIQDSIEYEVISIGGISNGVLLEGVEFLAEEVTSIFIPSTVRFVWNSPFQHPTIENIWVDVNNPYFRSIDGVLFTKSLYTLIQYPLANPRTQYTIPNETVIIGRDAFGRGDGFAKLSYLSQITFGEKVDGVGYSNWGDGYQDAPPTGMFGGNYVRGEFCRIQHSLAGDKIIIIHEDNPTYYCNGNAIYSSWEENGETCSILLCLSNATITSFEIEKSCKEIEDDQIFDLYRQLTYISIAEGNSYIIAKDGILYSQETKEIIAVPWAVGGDVEILDGVTSIDDWTFYGCENLTSVIIPDSVTSIGKNVFYGCSALTSIAIPDSVTSIGSWAFGHCTGLTSVIISNNVMDLNEYVFCGCSSLTNVVIPDSVLSVGQYAFGNCYELMTVSISKNIVSIGDAAFSRCYELNNVEIPRDIISIGKYVFAECTSLSDIYYTGTEVEWEAVEKGIDWCLNSVIVHCDETPSDSTETTQPRFLFDAPAMYDKATAIADNSINCLIAAAELRAEGKYVSILGAGSDIYFAAIPMNSRVRVGRYLVIKYRTTEDCDGELYLGSGSAWTGVGDHVVLDYIPDGEWHLLIVDLKNVEAVASSYVLGYLRVDCFTDGTDRMIDIAYIASFSSIEAAEAYDAQLGYEDVPYDATKPEKVENPDHMEDPVVPDGSGSYVVDMNKPANANVYKPSFPEAWISNPVCLLGYGNTVYLGNLDLSNYSKVLIAYSCDGTKVTADAFAAASSLDIGLKSSNSSFGQETDSNYEDAIAYTDMVFSEAGWHGAGVRTAEIDLSEITYSGNLWAAVHNPQGTLICIHSITFIEG